MNPTKILTSSAFATIALFSLHAGNIAAAAPNDGRGPRVEVDGAVSGPIGLHNDSAKVGQDCPADGNWWHFVTAPNNDAYAFESMVLNVGGSLVAVNSSQIVPNGDQLDNVFVAVPAGASANDLSADGSAAMILGADDRVKFVLSHICLDEQVGDNEITEDEVVEDEIVEDEVVEDDSKDEVVEDNDNDITEDEVADDEVTEDEGNTDEVVADSIPEDQPANEVIAQDNNRVASEVAAVAQEVIEVTEIETPLLNDSPTVTDEVAVASATLPSTGGNLSAAAFGLGGLVIGGLLLGASRRRATR
jgi:LPXTG-motif cell wall-anchored protein